MYAMASSQPNLCEYCRNIFNGPIENEDSPKYGRRQTFSSSRSFKRLEIQAKKEECYMCFHAWTGLKRSIQKSKRQLDMLRLVDEDGQQVRCVLLHSKEHDPKIRFGMFLNNDFQNHHAMEFFTVPFDTIKGGQECKVPEERIKSIISELPTSVACPTNWALLSRWLEQCNPTDHLTCFPSIPVESSYAPTRLLDVGLPGRLRVIITSDRQLDSSVNGTYVYIAMSHCWGKNKFLQLNATTSDQLFTGFNENLLPRSFQEAVIVARKLGISFIWIDSLCILQDSKEDWLHESKLMAEVYAGAYFTIAATGAHDGSEGLFLERNVSMIQPFPVVSSWTSRHRSRIHTESDRYLVFPSNYWEYMLDSPLLKRAWVVQERVLSRRIVHFTRSQLFWECSCLSACEVHPEGLPPHDFIEKAMGSELVQLKEAILGFYDSDEGQWISLVELYTSSQLTFASDRLAAVAGIAKAYGANGSRGRYLAGIWEKDFLWQLAWRQISGLTRKTSEDYRAPSWSWASVDGEIAYSQMPRPTVKMIFPTIRMLEVFNGTLDGQQQLADPRLYARVEAPLYKGIVWKRYNSKNPFKFEMCFKAAGLRSPWNGLNRKPIQVHFDQDFANREVSQQLYLMPLLILPGMLRADDKKNPDYQDFTMQGLILERCIEGESGHTSVLFRRTGLAMEEYYGPEAWPTSSTKFQRFPGRKQDPEERFEATRDEVRDDETHHLYTFTIV